MGDIIRFLQADGRTVQSPSRKRWTVGGTIVRGQRKFHVTSISRTTGRAHGTVTVAREVKAA